jgi:hypothetical protein
MINKPITIKSEDEDTLWHQAMDYSLSKLSLNTLKFMFIGISSLSHEEGNYTSTFNTADYFKMLGPDFKVQDVDIKEMLKKTARECLSTNIQIRPPNKGLQGHTWFYSIGLEKAHEDLGWQTVRMSFNPTLGVYAKVFRDAYLDFFLSNIDYIYSKKHPTEPLNTEKECEKHLEEKPAKKKRGRPRKAQVV